MRQVTQSRLDIIKLAEPNLKVETRDGKKVAVIPKYDWETDRSWELLLEVIPDPKGPTKMTTGLWSRLKVRKGNVARTDGDVHTTRDGKPFRIVDFDPDKGA